MYKSPKINIITLGCSKNVVDSERISAQLAAGGWEVVFDSDTTDAGVVVINTCGFIGDAKQESIDMILQCAAAKTRGDIDRLYVIGCLSERYRDELREEIPEVDRFFGARTIGDIVEELGLPWRREINSERLLSTPPHYAWLKISEGCNRGCGFCAIPLIRGRHVSFPMEQLIDEARRLVAKGVKELMVIAQDTTCYGIDLYGERRLGTLLHELCRIEGIEWIRLHYAYPSGFPDDVIEAIASEPKICKYLDIPLQHISDGQLAAMRRGTSRQEICDLIGKLRAAVPDIAIRTTMLVGYPGESEEDFTQLCDFVRQARFERLGVFTYSEEEGTYSALNLPDDIPQQVKERRAERLMELQSLISLEENEKKIGQTQRVVIDRRDGDLLIARSQYDSPEVDQEILIPAAPGTEKLKAGDFVTVRITSAQEYDLSAEIA